MNTAVSSRSWGAVDRVIRESDHLLLEGWVISRDAPLSGMRASVRGSSAFPCELVSNLPTPHLEGSCWKTPRASRAGFRATIPLAARDSLVMLVPILGGGFEGDAMASVIEPSLPVPPEDLIRAIGGGFQEVAFEFLGHLVAKLGLKPSDHVLDVGCGLGRIAFALCYYLEGSARYEGFDLSEPLIQWAKRTISARHPSFRFQRVDLRNSWYNPRGGLRAENFRFPYDDESFDAVVATSLFTHMRGDAVRRYLDEIHRVLRPGGRCLATCFLLDPESRRLMESGRSSQRLLHRMEDFFTADPRTPEGAIGFEQESLWSWILSRGFALESTFHGTWSGRSGPGSYQDLVIFRKATARPERPAPDRSATHLVACEAGGSVVLDGPMFRLWRRARSGTGENAVLPWSVEENQNPEIGRWALAVLERAGLLPGIGKATAVPDRGNEPSSPPRVSIIILNRDGRRHLEKLLPSIAEQTHPNLETIVVDNGSREDPSWIEESHPWVRVIALPEDAGFSGATNRGVREASGELFFFLNNDTWLEPTAIERLVARLEGEREVAAVVPLVRLERQPSFVNTLGNQIASGGFARDGYIGHLDVGQLSTVRRVPSASFGAVLIPRRAYETVGPLDESYGYYYEDMDWSWRARSSGLEILAEPGALVFHASGATSGTRPPEYKLRYVARNRLRFVAKNLPAGAALRLLWRYFQEDWREARRASGARNLAAVQAYRTAWAEFARMVPGILRGRSRFRGTRRVKGDRILSEMDEYPHPRHSHDGPVLGLAHVIEDYGPYLAETGCVSRGPEAERLRVLVASASPVREELSRSAMRLQKLALVLSRHVKVTFLVPAGTEASLEGMEVLPYHPGQSHFVREQLERADLAVVPFDLLVSFPFLRAGERPLAVDLHAPELLDWAGADEEIPLLQREVAEARRREACLELLQHGDFFLCASEHQRDFWLGMLLAAGRLGPLTRARDETFRSLIDVVPFGVSPEPFEPPALQEAVPGSGPGDKILLWMEEPSQDWNLPLEAIELVASREPRVRLCFFGAESERMRRAEERSRERDVLGTHVSFLPAAAPTRRSLLAASHLAVSAQIEGPEAHLSVRTGLLDAIGAGTPAVATGGDELAKLIRDHGLGRIVPFGEPKAMAEAILDLLSRSDAKSSRIESFERARAELSWESAAAPLLRFSLSPHPAFDRAARRSLGVELAEAHAAAATPVSRLPARALALLKERGALALLQKTMRHLKWRLSRLA